MRTRFALLAIGTVTLLGCGSGHRTEGEEISTNAISATCGHRPSTGPCITLVCDSDGTWDPRPKLAGTACNVTGKCDGNGTCVTPPPPPPPPIDCDHPPKPRYTQGQNGSYPFGADVISCLRPSAGVEQWTIYYPSVDRATTDYPAIAFSAGDSVDVIASGCAQSGGTGLTWKRYLDPKRDDGRLDEKYYAMLQISGVTGETLAHPLSHWVGHSFVTPNPTYLRLGYVDDDYSDNGYWGQGRVEGIAKATLRDFGARLRPHSPLVLFP